jgi:uncharacterized membrane protein
VNSLNANALHGIGFAVLATACFATLDTTTRHVSAGRSMLVALWFRYAIQAVITTVVVWPGRGRKILRTQHPRFQLARGLLLFACSTLAFLSLKYMPVGEFTAISLLAPLVITILAAWMLKEKIRPLRWLLVLGGFIGTLIIIRPGSQHFDWTVLLPPDVGGYQLWISALDQQNGQNRGPHHHPLLYGLDRHGLGHPHPAFCLGNAQRLDGLVATALDGRAGLDRALFADPGLRPRPSRHPHALFVHPNRLCGAGRLAGLQPPA